MSRSMYATTIDGREVVHIPNSNGDYATLCLIDDGLAGIADGIESVPLKRGAKITCAQCKAIWETARQYRASDFSTQTI
uniref:Uncharacterized protein n=1 Tax=viral metagenome TaxID=1070528 RepID=A0A6H1ZIH2_9ZZZZ